MERTNEDRAADALVALGVHGTAVNPDAKQLDVEEALTDLLVDLRHLADQLDIDWTVQESRIGMHFEAEQE